MIINFRQLATRKDETISFQEQIDISDLVRNRTDILSSEPLSVELDASYVSGAVQVAGKLETRLELSCSRCLEHFYQPLEIPFYELFVHQKVKSEDTDADDADEDEDIHFIPEEKFDITPFVEENVLLSLPFIPVCEEECKGLCPVCGADRNLQPCECKTEKADPRLEGLKEWFNK
jgi:uncharacterized protein